MHFEQLERRRLLSTSLSSAGVLTVTGTDGPDTLYVTGGSDGKIHVRDDAVAYTFPKSKVKLIVLKGGASADHLEVTADVTIPAVLYSGSGGQYGPEQPQDVLIGGGGPDKLHVGSAWAEGYGGPGNDVLYNGPATPDDQATFQSLNGQAGNDTFVMETANTDSHFDGGPGTDTIDYSSQVGGIYIDDGLAGGSYRGDGKGNADLNADGRPSYIDGGIDSFDAMENFTGGSGRDYIYGTAGANVLKGLGGNDELYGGDGNDTLYGGYGKDALFGQGGDDTLYAQGDGAVDFLSGGTGFDKGHRDASDVVNSVEVKI